MSILGRHVSSRLAAYIDGELRSREARRVTLHLERCERCRRELDLVQSGMTAVEHLSLEQAPKTPCPPATGKRMRRTRNATAGFAAGATVDASEALHRLRSKWRRVHVPTKDAPKPSCLIELTQAHAGSVRTAPGAV
jgi:anti-sigma factor RsiW